MSKITAILIDDEDRARRVLRNLLENNNYSIDILAECTDLESGVSAIKKHQPMVVFLDVKMPNFAGYEIVNFFEEISFEIIFVTAYHTFAIKAFELCAIDYLVKPINRNRLSEAIEKLTKKISEQNNLEAYRVLLDTIQQKSFNKLVIPELGNRRIIDLNSIVAIEADGAYTGIYTLKDQKITTSKNLKFYEKAVVDDVSFFRSHRSWLVNINYINFFNRTENKLYLKNNIVAKISRSQYESFNQLFNKAVNN